MMSSKMVMPSLLKLKFSERKYGASAELKMIVKQHVDESKITEA